MPRYALSLIVGIAGLLAVTAVDAQALCGTGTTPACNPTSVVAWVAPTTNANGTPLTDLSGYEVLVCPGVVACTRTTAGVLVRDVGFPGGTCTNGLGEVIPSPCISLASLNVGAAGTKSLVVAAYDTATPRNVSALSVAYGPFVFSSVIPDLLAPSAPLNLQVR